MVSSISCLLLCKTFLNCFKESLLKVNGDFIWEFFQSILFFEPGGLLILRMELKQLQSSLPSASEDELFGIFLTSGHGRGSWLGGVLGLFAVLCNPPPIKLLLPPPRPKKISSKALWRKAVNDRSSPRDLAGAVEAPLSPVCYFLCSVTVGFPSLWTQVKGIKRDAWNCWRK